MRAGRGLGQEAGAGRAPGKQTLPAQKHRRGILLVPVTRGRRRADISSMLGRSSRLVRTYVYGPLHAVSISSLTWLRWPLRSGIEP